MADKFTPGPWRVEDPMADIELSIIKDDGSPVYSWTFIASVTGPKDNIETAANARLIAAAPTMYALIQRLTVAWDTVGANGSEHFDEVARDVAVEAAALVAKVEGGGNVKTD